jgi:aspartate aminotransferase
MFAHLKVAPPDPVFGLAEMFRADSNPAKINLTVGAYQTDDGETPILDSVKRAEELILAKESTKNYLPIDGTSNYANLVARLIFGDRHPVISDRRYATAHTPGGTGALRISADFLRQQCNTKTIWVGNPTWANHPQIFAAAGLHVEWFPYLTSDRRQLDFGSILDALGRAGSGDAVLLHTVCHNPTGFDLSHEQWREALAIVKERRLIPIFDFAYQGLGQGLDADAEMIREFLANGQAALICSSFSKNMGLYGERVGALTVVTEDATSTPAALSQVKSIIRTIYSTPPQHGGAIAETILSNEGLRQDWMAELETMRLRIIELRETFVQRLSERILDHDFGFIRQQVGMFSFSGLTREQVIRLREEFAIYAVESGRINIAGINSRNIEPLCEAIAKCVEQTVSCEV